MNVRRDDTHAAVEAAYDAQMAEIAEATAPEPEVAPEPVEAAPEAAPEPVDTKARDEQGRFAKEPKVTKKASAKEAPSSPAAKAEAKPAGKAVAPPAPTDPAGSPPSTEAAEETAAPQPEGLKPPASLTPEEREAWMKAPTELQRAFHRRDKEVNTALQQSANARRLESTLAEVFRPYEAIIRGKGVHPLDVVKNTMEIAHTLEAGSEDQKADLFARLLNSSKANLEKINERLANPQAQAPAAPRPEQFRDPRLDQLLQQAEQRMLSKANQEIDDFASKNEFAEKLMPQMSLMLEFASQRGIAMSLKDAYDKCMALDPEISKVMKQREAAKSVATVQAATQRAKAVASSVKPSPAVSVPTGKQKLSEQDAVRAAWDALSSDR